MIVRNFLELPGEMGPSHNGVGEVRATWVYRAEDFETPLQFLIYTEVPPGTSVGLHTHGNDEEMYVILDGEGTMTVNGETRVVKKGDAILNKPGWTHGLENTSDKVLRMLVFEVKMEG